MSSIPKLLKLKDYVTLIGTTLSLIAVCCAIIGTLYFISLGFFFVTLTVGTDLMDGYIARKTGTVNELGKELDSLNDSLAFGIAPAVLTFQSFRTEGPFDFVLLIGAICFALGAILRLARFNIQEDKSYTGLATPLSALFLICYFYANYFYIYYLNALNEPFPLISSVMITILMILLSWLNVTTYMYFPEKGKIVYILFIVFLPFAPIFGILGLFLNDLGQLRFGTSLAISICFIGFLIAESILIIFGFYNKSKIGRKKQS